MLENARARQLRRMQGIPRDARLGIRSCHAILARRSGRLLGYSGSVAVDDADTRASGSDAISVYLDENLEKPRFEAATERVIARPPARRREGDVLLPDL
jgi:hypothetical protein